MDVKTTFRNIVRDQSVSICMLQYLVVTLAFLKNPRSGFSLEIRPQTQSAFSAVRALLPPAKYSAELSGRV
jgi:hypothetical protein